MPKHVPREPCVPESILTTDGKEETVMLHPRYTPYQRRASSIANICGAFTETASPRNVSGLVVDTVNQFGKQKEMFSVHGNVVFTNGRATFMGARGMASLERLSQTLALSSPKSLVHMAVLCARVGKRLQVRASGLLESRLLTHHRAHITVGGRGFDVTNAVNLAITKFTDPLAGVPIEADEQPTFAMEKRFRPDKNSWAVTGRGTIHVRFSWAGIEWSRECEAACTALCDRVIGRCIASTPPPH